MDKIMRLFGKENINNIIISNEFKNTVPKPNKMRDKWLFYKVFGEFKERIVLDEDNCLVDGYTSYLIAKEEGKKYVPVTKLHCKAVRIHLWKR